MDPNDHDKLVSSIYAAAVDEGELANALAALAAATDCGAATLEVYSAGGVRLVGACNPMMPQALKDEYMAHWRHNLPFRRPTDGIAVGTPFGSEAVWDCERLVRSAFYNDWLVSRAGLGGWSRYANLEANGRAVAVLGAFKRLRRDFTPEQSRLFANAVPHFVRAFAIRRRLRVAEAQRDAPTAGAPEGFLVVDDRGRVLTAENGAQRRLRAAGVIASPGAQGSIRGDNPALERLIFGAARRGAGGRPKAGTFEHRGQDGASIRISVLPIVLEAKPYDPWLAVERPAALLYVANAEDVRRERIGRLIEQFGLTAAEAAVAIEAAKGDGRAAVAVRLAIRETTVRSHLSAIFDKLDIHRQAELARIVAGT